MMQASRTSLALSAAISLAIHSALLLGPFRIDLAGAKAGNTQTLKIELLPPAQTERPASAEPAATGDTGPPPAEADEPTAASTAPSTPESPTPAATPIPAPASPPPESAAQAIPKPAALDLTANRQRAVATAATPTASAAAPRLEPRVEPEPKTAAAATRIAVAGDPRRMLDEQAAVWAAAMSAQALPESGASWQHGDTDYRAEFTRLPAIGSMGLEQVIATVYSEHNDEPVATRMTMTRLAFSNFGQLIDRWDPSVQIHDDEIDGRFHSNSEIFIDHSVGIQPTFHGKVTTARNINTSNSRNRIRRNEIFLGGLETRTPRIALPKTLLFEHAKAGGSGIHSFERDTRIRFLADGSYEYADAEEPGVVQRRTLTGAENYLIAAGKTVLHVRGIVNGHVLVYSPRGIVIEGDLTYAADPGMASADDYLGLASDASVTVADPDVTGPGDLRIHAAIYAKSRFAVRSYRHREAATLFIHGSVTAGSLSATEPRYRTRLDFDERFEHTRPPGFPLTERYELAAWDGLWHSAQP
jgi:hypothetical protein